jgi:ribose 5-phosphate isomerase A
MCIPNRLITGGLIKGHRIESTNGEDTAVATKSNAAMVTDQASDKKRKAAEEAVSFVRSGTIVGLGTGSTVQFALEAIARRIKSDGLKIHGIPTSTRTETEAKRLGIPLTTLEDHPLVDLTIDGADEIDPQLNLIKGGGGALVREKVIATSSSDVLIIADDAKLVVRLGTTFPVPVEILPFARPLVERGLKALGSLPKLRTQANGSNYVTDNGNWILDARFARLDDPARMEREITLLAGVVDCGIFTGLADLALIGTADGVRRLRP